MVPDIEDKSKCVPNDLCLKSNCNICRAVNWQGKIKTWIK